MGITRKGIEAVQKWCSEMGHKECAKKMINYHISKLTMGMTSDEFADSMTFANGIDAIETFLGDKDYPQAWEEAKEVAREMLEDEGFYGMFENKTIKENKKMKRVKYKKELPSLKESLKLIPNKLKIDNQVIEMTDGNKTYRVRWEGSLQEGKAIALFEEDKKLVTEDIERMKSLWGYKSEKTMGTTTPKSRLTENEKFNNLLSTVKKMDFIEEAVPVGKKPPRPAPNKPKDFTSKKKPPRPAPIKEFDGDEFIPHLVYTLSNSGGYEIMLSDDGDAAKVKDAYGSDNPQISDWLEIEYVPNEETGEHEPVIDPNGYNIPLNLAMKI